SAPNAKSAAMRTVACSTSSFGTLKRSRSNGVSVDAASTTAIAPACRTRNAPLLIAVRLACDSPAKSPAEDHFQNQAVGGVVQAEADAGIKLPVRREVQVDRRKQLLRSAAAVVLHSPGDFRRHVVFDVDCRGERETVLERRIERHVPAPHLLVDD